MENQINLITVPFDMEWMTKIVDGKMPGAVQINSPWWTCDCRIICYDAKGDYPIIALLERREEEVVERFNIKGQEILGHKLKNLVLRVPELLTYKEGDVVACHNKDNTCQWISVVKEVWEGEIIGMNEYVSYILEGECRGELEYNSYSDTIGNTRSATEEEKQMLIEALKEDKCEESKKILKQFFNFEETENVTESKQEPVYNLQPFDKVLVRDSKDGKWNIEIFGYEIEGEEFKYKCIYDNYLYCIPYNEATKHLLGTTKDWEEQQ